MKDNMTSGMMNAKQTKMGKTMEMPMHKDMPKAMLNQHKKSMGVRTKSKG